MQKTKEVHKSLKATPRYYSSDREVRIKINKKDREKNNHVS
jgi:hypothetical protein